MTRRVDSIKDEIDELKKKLTLIGMPHIYIYNEILLLYLLPSLDGDKRAYFENTQWEMERNRVQIQKLRQENKDLRAKLSKKMAVSLLSLSCILYSINTIG